MMARPVSSALLLLILCGPSILLAQEGKLEKIREDVSREEPSCRKEKSDDDDNWCDDEGEDDDGDDCLSGELLLFLLTSPFTVPHVCLGDALHEERLFPPYPYAAGAVGYMQYEPAAGAIHPFDRRRLRRWAGRLSVEGSTDFDGLDRVNGQLLLETTSRFGLQASWSSLHEDLGGRRKDHLALGDANLVFRFAQNEFAQFRAGLGFRWLAGGGDPQFGFNFIYGADLYPVKPLVLSASIGAGTLGSAGVFHGRATAGFNLSRWEFYGGYDYLRIGCVELHGPVVGVRLWF